MVASAEKAKAIGKAVDATPQATRLLAMLNAEYPDVPLSWRISIKNAVTDAAWDTYDGSIKDILLQYQQHLTGTNMPALDWHLIKAMLWVETGPQSAKWSTIPMQIGAFLADKGLNAVLKGTENTFEVMPSQLRKDLSFKTATSDPIVNIQVGIGYLLARMCQTKEFSEVDPADKGFEHIVEKSAPSFSDIARKFGSSAEVLMKINHTASAALHVGDKLLIKKAINGKRIMSWTEFTEEKIAERYNGNGINGIGDEFYAKKLHYALPVTQLKDSLLR